MAIYSEVERADMGSFSAFLGKIQAAGAPESLATNTVDDRDAFRQLPVCFERKMLAVVNVKGQHSKTRGCVPQTQSAGATAAVLGHTAISTEMATVAVR